MSTATYNVGTCSASWEGCSPQVFVNHAYWACVAPTMLEESNIVALRFSDHGTKEILGVVG